MTAATAPLTPEHCAIHSFRFQGVVYRLGDYKPGSDARGRKYLDRYYCTHCLLVRDRNPREDGHYYREPLPGTFPA